MGKHGPCSHCGVTSTPLWRNGPPEKPVLCNACGSRWRTKGSLVNYTPLHARSEPNSLLDYSKFWKVKSTADLKNKEAQVLKRKPETSDAVDSVSNHGFSKAFDEDTRNRSSSGSALSNSESFMNDGNATASPSQIVVWDSAVPSKKRTCVARTKPSSSSVEKLTKDLYTIWNEQQQSSCLSGYSEEDVLLETDKPMVSVEIGHGSVLIKHPISIVQEEESVASSLSFETKPSEKDRLRELQILNYQNSQIRKRNAYLQDFKSCNDVAVGEGLIKFGANHSIHMKSPQGIPLQKHTGHNVLVRNPRGSNMNLPHDQKEVIVRNGDLSSSSHLFPSHGDNGCSAMEDSNFADDNSNQDLLLDVPSNGSFPQAELLLPTSRVMF